MAIRKSTAPPEETPPEDEGTPSAVVVDPDQLKDAVRSVLGEFGLGTGGGEETPKEEEAKASTGRRTLRDEEADMEGRVTREVERIRAADALVDRVKAVEEKVTEKPPGQMKKLTKALWGGE